MKNSAVRCLTLGLLCIAGNFTALATEIEGESSSWKGFEKISFQVDGRNAYVVLPESPARNNPWVWRTRVPNWHTDVDLHLLEKRYSIGYIKLGGPFSIYPMTLGEQKLDGHHFPIEQPDQIVNFILSNSN